MEKNEIKFSDWERILLGNAPLEFLAEVLVRSLITYAILIIVLKLFGKRMSGQFGNTEMAVMLMLGAVVSGGMQMPDRGFLQVVFVLMLMLLLQRSLTLWTYKSRKIEKAVMGTASLIVKDGVIQLNFMNKELLSQKQLFRDLRTQSVYQLGEIKRVYMETNGKFSIIRHKNARPGLIVLPRDDEDLLSLLEADKTVEACTNCGNTMNIADNAQCPVCGSPGRTPAMIRKKSL